MASRHKSGSRSDHPWLNTTVSGPCRPRAGRRRRPPCCLTAATQQRLDRSENDGEIAAESLLPDVGPVVRQLPGQGFGAVDRLWIEGLAQDFTFVLEFDRRQIGDSRPH